MAKTVYVVSKTHLDLGYTNLAERVVDKYVEKYIPNAIQIAKEVNTDGKKFVWTLGSWLIDRALRDDNEKRVKELEEACQRGDIVAHAMPFTVQSELEDVTLFEDGLKIIKALDKRFGRKTIAAKMTDVPGHTKGIVPILAKHGIKLLHIGVNAASKVPDVPPVFLWECDGAQIVVVYEGSYGGVIEHPAMEEVLVFDHSMDNCGPRDAKTVLKNFQKIKKKYKDYTVVGGTLDDIAQKLWDIKDELPLLRREIGDTWIHGASSDPYKYGALRMLEEMRSEWVRKRQLSPDSEEYRVFSDNLLCLAEHTAGRGVLNAFRDYDNYLKPDFLEARKADAKIPRRGIFRLPFLRDFMKKRGGKGRYTRMTKSWNEQRDYVIKAIEALPLKLYVEAFTKLKALRPDECLFPNGENIQADKSVKCGKWKIQLNSFGAPKNLNYGNTRLISENQESLVDYKSIGPADYKFWFKHYSRNLYKTFTWAIPDFGRPGLCRVAKYYPQGVFPYTMSEAVLDKTKEFERITVRLVGRKQIMPQLGMPRKLTVQYIFFENYMQLRLEWTDKDVSRLPEEIWLHFGIFPDKKGIFYHKLGQKISPYEIVRNGARNLSVTEGIEFDAEGKIFRLQPKQAIPVSLGRGKLLRFDNEFANSREGVSFLIQNNIWGTNYPLWYEDNASVWFDLAPQEEFEKGFKSYEPKIQVNVVKPKALDDKKYVLTDEERAAFNKAVRNAVNNKPAPSTDGELAAADIAEEDELRVIVTKAEPKTAKSASGKSAENKKSAKPAYSGLGIVKPIMDRATVLNDDLIEPTDDDDDAPVSVSPLVNRRMVTLGENASSGKGKLSIQSRTGARIVALADDSQDGDESADEADKKSADKAMPKKTSNAKSTSAKSAVAKTTGEKSKSQTAKTGSDKSSQKSGNSKQAADKKKGGKTTVK